MWSTILVADEPDTIPVPGVDVITFDTYLQTYPKLKQTKVRVINLCNTARYLSHGYYCSLLAEARQHQVLPSIRVVNDMREGSVTVFLPPTLAPDSLKIGATEQPLLVCMGEVVEPEYRKLAVRLFQRFPAPFLRAGVERLADGIKAVVSLVSPEQLDAAELEFGRRTMEDYSRGHWRTYSERKKYRWDLAILHSPGEAVPPSNRGAISRFIKAGEKLGIKTRTITAEDINSLSQFDALFIRETTAIDHHTYKMAREAEQKGLTVIDDSQSILRCCNKVYLHDAFSYSGVPAIPSLIISDASEDTVRLVESELGYPVVLKMPEGSFSKGVFKAGNRESLTSTVCKMLAESALVLAQRYVYTEFDWRIGVLNGRALYACRYYMAEGHWQIYNHASKKHFSGGFDALPTFEVPRKVLNAACKAAAIVGNGLYGIDIKEVDGRACVLEVNDNPSIDHGVEDAYLGDELYMQIMSEFLRRLELRGR